ncbi:hypothetical protein [Sinorhizobium meliloti]|uniref:hypothetical protein n=1 Tax=Rhizobium meliloti TaxID=382 RepID=UPI0003714A97|nr:hypothetical protein [Sinorhizobium meliloti]
MVEDEQAVIEWSEFKILSITPTEARVAQPAVSPDGRQISILIEGLTARTDITAQATAASILVGSITPKIPARSTWSAMRADFRGQAVLTNGARTTIQLGLGRASDSQTLTTPLPCGENNVEILRSLYSPVEATLPDSESGEVTYGAITISIMVTVASTGPESAALVEFDSIDLDLWTR